MLFFVVYAVVVWYLNARFRRRWEGFAGLIVGTGGLLTLAWLHWMLNIWTHGAIFLPVLQVILYPYILLVAAVGLFLCCLPYLPDHPCRKCRYDLAGLDPGENVCPECGTPVEIPEQEEVELVPLPNPVDVPSRRRKMEARRRLLERSRG